MLRSDNACLSESFRTRSEVDDGANDKDEGDIADYASSKTRNIAPIERFRHAARTYITLQSLEKMMIDNRQTTSSIVSVANLTQATHQIRSAGSYTVIAFVNSYSGGGMGKVLFEDLITYLGRDFVFDLGACHKGNMPEDKLIVFARDQTYDF